MKKLGVELKWGLIFVGLSLLWMYFEKWMGWHGENIEQHPKFTNLFAIVAILVYVFALLDKRKNYHKGKMSWLQGFYSGLFVTAVVAILAPGTQWFTSIVITPEYFPNVIDYAVSQGEMTQIEAEDYFNLGNYIFQSLIFAAGIGVVTSAVVAFFVKKK